ncbi:MAG: ATP-binding protein [Blautia sp.]|nr:ATP-binding protein [Blautia sp.]MCM1200798.1 ATP-binding protein [Bacteroides fragilis]
MEALIMGMYLNLGNAGFTSIRKGLYVDKTGLISHINKTLGTVEKLTCVSRPRRFGKSFATKMLCAYYDKSCDSRALFEGLEIADDPSFEEYMNRYDVLYLDITWFISICGKGRNLIDFIQEQVIDELMGLYPFLGRITSLPLALSKISELTGSKFIVIVDEWDALFREAKENDVLQKEYIQLLRGLFKSSLTDGMIEAAYMTGILPIKKYGTQSAMTDFREYTMTAPRRLAGYTGFTESEVRKLCEHFHMDFEETKKWYDGYSFKGAESIYNPNAIIQAVQNGEFGTYWTETETYESLKVYIDMDLDGLKQAIVSMLGGENYPIDIRTFQNDMLSINSKDDVLTLLVHLGYLAYEISTKSVYIPNEEVRQEFIRAVKHGKHAEIADLIVSSDKLLQDTLAMNEKNVAAAIEKAHSASAAPTFYNNEQALRSVIRLAYISCIDEYKEIQELPSGIGYADVVYLPKKSSAMPVMVIELKWNKSAEGAIGQIKEKKYSQIFEDYGSDILLVGINYDEKTKKHACRIEKYCM